ncbi:MAG: hypothetical protein ACOZBZ_00460 [Patescibacteria group bacterium]
MDTEKELLSIISKEDFNILLEKFKRKFGKPKKTKRLAIQCTDYDYQDIDTRVRVTNGVAEIIQKVGKWNATSRIEIRTPLPPSSDAVFNAYKTLRNLLKRHKIETSIIQLENWVFERANFEIKLTHQFGKKDVYNYEIEVLSDELSPLDIASKFNMPIDSPLTTPEFWKQWNESVNLYADQLSDDELKNIISNYF